MREWDPDQTEKPCVSLNCDVYCGQVYPFAISMDVKKNAWSGSPCMLMCTCELVDKVVGDSSARPLLVHIACPACCLVCCRRHYVVGSRLPQLPVAVARDREQREQRSSPQKRQDLVAAATVMKTWLVRDSASWGTGRMTRGAQAKWLLSTWKALWNLPCLNAAGAAPKV